MVYEKQRIFLDVPVVNEVQQIRSTVSVTNEVQTVTTLMPAGIDEVANAEGKTLDLGLYAYWRELGGDEHTGGSRQ